MKVLFIGKEGDSYSRKAADFIQANFKDPVIVFSKRTEPFPEQLKEWKGDLLISYLAQWIIPATLLQNAKWGAINFHPGPPEYPGIGCTNFAIYNREKEFGITCHHMLAKVDSGAIIAVKKFPISEDDTVYTVTQKCYVAISDLFYELMNGIMVYRSLPQSAETWKRKPYTRKQLNELCELKPDMDKDEIALRLKATTYGEKVWAYMKNDENITSYSSYKE
jgi:methionyl-tRNA formyltransferase